MLKENSLAKLLVDGPRALLWQATETNGERWLIRIVDLSKLDFSPSRLQTRQLYQFAKESPRFPGDTFFIIRKGTWEKNAGYAGQNSKHLGRHLVEVDYMKAGLENITEIEGCLSQVTHALAMFPCKPINLSYADQKTITTTSPNASASQVIKMRLVGPGQTHEIHWWTSAETNIIDLHWRSLWDALGVADAFESITDGIYERFEVGPLGEYIDINMWNISESCDEIMSLYSAADDERDS